MSKLDWLNPKYIEERKKAAEAFEMQARNDGRIKTGFCSLCGNCDSGGEVYQYILGSHLPDHYCSSACAIKAPKCSSCRKHLKGEPYYKTRKMQWCSEECRRGYTDKGGFYTREQMEVGVPMPNFEEEANRRVDSMMAELG